MDIIDRLNDPELYVDAIDDAVKEIRFLRGRVAQLEAARLQPGTTVPAIEIVNANDIDPEILDDLETQLLSAELDHQGNPRFVLQPSGDPAEIADEETFQLLDAEWNKPVE